MGKSEIVDGVPVIGAALRRVAGHKVQRLLGFWVVWHSFGSSRLLVDSGIMARSTEHLQRQEFREVFGCEVWELWPEEAKHFGRGRVMSGPGAGSPANG